MPRIPGRAMSIVVLLLLLAGTVPSALGAVRVVATTTIVGDVVSRIGDDAIDLVILLPVDADPHAFEPTPQDRVAIARADVLVLNGAGLEAGLESILETATGVIVDLSEGIALRTLDEDRDEHDGENQEEHDHEHGESDPHTWFDPMNVAVWTDTLAEALAAIDPENAAAFRENAQAYRLELETLDRWIAEQVETVPVENRRLVTDHTVFGYFANRYGFEQVGAIFPGFSTVAEPSAQELAALQDTIRLLDIPAVFVGSVFPPGLAEQITADTGTRLVTLYTGSLSGPEGPAATYLEMMRFDVEAIVGGLTSDG